jgi:1-carboxybiuret hydrolase subunit AtzG-like
MKRKAARKAKSAPAKRPRPARAAAKTKPENSVDALVAASAQALSLTLDPAWHKSIAFNLRLILHHAALVDQFALPDDAEPAPVFHA